MSNVVHLKGREAPKGKKSVMDSPDDIVKRLEQDGAGKVMLPQPGWVGR